MNNDPCCQMKGTKVPRLSKVDETLQRSDALKEQASQLYSAITEVTTNLFGDQPSSPSLEKELAPGEISRLNANLEAISDHLQDIRAQIDRFY